MSEISVTRGNPVEVTVVKGDPVVVELSYSVGGSGGSGTVTSITAGDGLSGGTITTSGTIAIADGGVSYAKLVDLVASRLVGRGSSGGTGDPEPIQIGSGLTMTGTTLSATAGSGTVTVVETIYETSQDVTPNANAKWWIVEMVGGGGAGNGGTTAAGGFGGASGSYAFGVIPSANFGATMSLTVGQGAATSANAGGQTRIVNNTTSQTLLSSAGALPSSSASAHFPLAASSNTGYGAGGANGLQGRHGGLGSGGGGCGATAVASSGFAGGLARSYAMQSNGMPQLGGGSSGGASGATGTAGTAGTISTSGFGNGGGGGGGGTTGAGGAGGAGVRGSGGGGGGICTSGTSAGGAGGNGFIRVVELRIA